MTKIVVFYRDELGYASAEVASNLGLAEPISFCDGFCYFTDANMHDRKIAISALVEIQHHV